MCWLVVVCVYVYVYIVCFGYFVDGFVVGVGEGWVGGFGGGKEGI